MPTPRCTLTATLQGRPEKRKELMALLESFVPRSRAEKGCIDYHFHVGADDPNVFYFYENWTSRADLDVHLQPALPEGMVRTARRVPGQARGARASSRCSATTTRH